MSKETTNFTFGPELHDFADQIARTIVESTAETGEYRGCGGHGVQDHGGHGEHSQVSIGVGERTVNIRKTYCRDEFGNVIADSNFDNNNS